MLHGLGEWLISANSLDGKQTKTIHREAVIKRGSDFLDENRRAFVTCDFSQTKTSLHIVSYASGYANPLEMNFIPANLRSKAYCVSKMCICSFFTPNGNKRVFDAFMNEQ